MRAYLEQDGRYIRMITPYDEDFLQAMRAAIPKWAKHFDGDTRHWLVEGAYREQLLAVLHEYFERVSWIMPLEDHERLLSEAVRTARDEAEWLAEESARSEYAYQLEAAEHDPDDCLAAVRARWPSSSLLNVLPDAPYHVVEGAYRALAKRHHPDRAGAGSTALMAAINAAYAAYVRGIKEGAPV